MFIEFPSGTYICIRWELFYPYISSSATPMRIIRPAEMGVIYPGNLEWCRRSPILILPSIPRKEKRREKEADPPGGQPHDTCTDGRGDTVDGQKKS
jgi:hypothetical protein